MVGPPAKQARQVSFFVFKAVRWARCNAHLPLPGEKKRQKPPRQGGILKRGRPANFAGECNPTLPTRNKECETTECKRQIEKHKIKKHLKRLILDSEQCRVPDVANRCRASEFARLNKVEYNDTTQQDSTRFIDGLAELLVHHLR